MFVIATDGVPLLIWSWLEAVLLVEFDSTSLKFVDFLLTGVTETPGGPLSCHFAWVARFIFTTLPPPSADVDGFGAAGVRDIDPFEIDPPIAVKLAPAGVSVTDPLFSDPLIAEVTDDPLEIWAETAGIPPFGVRVTEPIGLGKRCFCEPSFINFAIPEVTGCFAGWEGVNVTEDETVFWPEFTGDKETNPGLVISSAGLVDEEALPDLERLDNSDWASYHWLQQ